jgi:membrane associated rhomboid family serine protease
MSGDAPAPGPALTPRRIAVLAAVAAAIVLPELLLMLADRGLVGSTRWRGLAYQYGGFWAGLLHGWRPNFPAQPTTMFVTHAFLHAGPGHLIGNLGALLAVGPPILGRFGAGGFLAIYAAAVLGGGIAFGLLSGSAAPMVGASGAIFGLVGAWAWMQGDARARAGAGPVPVAVRVLGIAAGLALLNLVMWLLADGVLAWETHLGGFLAGVGMAALLAPAPQPQRPPLRKSA